MSVSAGLAFTISLDVSDFFLVFRSSKLGLLLSEFKRPQKSDFVFSSPSSVCTSVLVLLQQAARRQVAAAANGSVLTHYNVYCGCRRSRNGGNCCLDP